MGIYDVGASPPRPQTLNPNCVCEWLLAQIKGECQTAREKPNSEKWQWIKILHEKSENPKRRNQVKKKCKKSRSTAKVRTRKVENVRNVEVQQ